MACVYVCVRVFVLGKRAGWLLVKLQLTSYSDSLTGFSKPLSPHYRLHTGLKNDSQSQFLLSKQQILYSLKQTAESHVQVFCVLITSDSVKTRNCYSKTNIYLQFLQMISTLHWEKGVLINHPPKEKENSPCAPKLGTGAGSDDCCVAASQWPPWTLRLCELRTGRQSGILVNFVFLLICFSSVQQLVSEMEIFSFCLLVCFKSIQQTRVHGQVLK